MKILVVTGGIGSGKSEVSRLLRERGIAVYDCDSSVKRLYKTHLELAAMLSEDLFRNPAKLDALEKVLYPVLMDDFREWAVSNEAEIVGIESAILLQKPYFNGFGDYVLWVDAPLEQRIARVLKRGGIDSESLRERLALQQDEGKDTRVTKVIHNEGTLEELAKQIDDFLKEINYVKRENRTC